MLDQLIHFLIERKFSLLIQQKNQPNKRSKDLTEAQIRCIESILIFVAQNKSKESVDMAGLQLSLDKEARSMDELTPRRSNNELTQAVLSLTESLKPGTFKQINTEQVKPRSLAAKIYLMKKQGALPKNVTVITRGKEMFLARAK